MKAMLLSEYKKLSITEMPAPAPGPGELLVRVHSCGVCGSDIHGYDGSSGRRIPPLVMGHEAAGVVERVGQGVDRFAPGERVTFDSMVTCGVCRFCRQGLSNLCDNRRVLGVSCGDYRQHGAFAEFVVVPQIIAYKLPDELRFEHAAMIEPVSVAMHAVNITPIRLGDTAVVVGTGMIGLLVVQAARLAGCGQIIAVDLDEGKLKLARELGADVALNPKTVDVPAEVARRTDGAGADVSFEVVGATPTVAAALASVRKGGAVTLVGNLAPTVELGLQSVVTREITLRGSCGICGEYPQTIAMLASGRIRVDPLISRIAPLDEGPELFGRLYSGEPGLMKVILQP